MRTRHCAIVHVQFAAEEFNAPAVHHAAVTHRYRRARDAHRGARRILHGAIDQLELRALRASKWQQSERTSYTHKYTHTTTDTYTRT